MRSEPGSRSVATIVSWSSRVELVGCGGAEDVLEGGLEGHVAEVVVGEVDDRVAVEGAHPRAVVEHLGDDIAWGLVALELQDVEVALAVHGEQVDELAVWRLHLSANDEQPLAEQRRVLLEVLLQRRLGRQRGSRLRRFGVSPSIRHIPISTGMRHSLPENARACSAGIPKARLTCLIPHNGTPVDRNSDLFSWVPKGPHLMSSGLWQRSASATLGASVDATLWA
jgi:hypothetical protein